MSCPRIIAPEFRNLPFQCWEVCNKAYQQARLFDIFPEYCKPESAYQISHSNCLLCTVLGVVGGLLLIVCIGKRREPRKKDLELESTVVDISARETETLPMIQETEGSPRTEMEVEERACELDLGSGYSEMDVQPRTRR
ncbi:hypothetical protein QBC41DRAFT_353716 [Cercophora samala]|uniref:Uncharacterized protein n=1 Tax=Cercophora samala TaxID=330535 RepID=A0AA39ZJ18_9PEZI|nr:hypothetical protein QBC41DRAFT_353716 [Cercophora samala]